MTSNNMNLKGYTDLAELPEDDRIKIICEMTLERKLKTCFIVEDDEKADRYIEKCKQRYPKIVIGKKVRGFPTVGVISVPVMHPDRV